MNLFFPGAASLARRISRGATTTQTTLTATIVASANPTPSDANYTYTVQVDNTGVTNAATSIVATVTLDSSLTYVSASGTGWTFEQSGVTVTCTKTASLAASSSAGAITITVTAGNAANASVLSSVSAVGSNTNTAMGSSTIAVAQPADTVTIVDNLTVTGKALSNQAIAYTVQYTNSGAGTIFGISVATTLDASLAYVSSSGTGWTIGVVGQVVTATLASLAVGAANPITINVTTGSGATSASTSVSATATNAATATATDNTTVYSVTKDSTSGWYMPASSTEWTNFIAAKGLNIANPNSLWLCQESSGNLADSIGSITLTASGTPSYAQSATGFARKGVLCHDGSSDRFTAGSGVGPSPATTSQTWLGIFSFPATPASTRLLWGIDVGSSGSGFYSEHLSTSGDLQAKIISTTAAGTHSMSSGAHLVGVTYDRTNSNAMVTSDLDKLLPTYSSSVIDGNKGMGSTASAMSGSTMVMAYMWSGANGELTAANMKALYQAMGPSIAWS